MGNSITNKYAPLAVIVLAQMVITGDNAIIGIITAVWMVAFSTSIDQIQMANAVYALTSAAFMTAGGMLGLAIGWRRIFVIGALLLAMGEAVTMLAPNIQTIIWGARVLCGLGASLLVPATIGLCAVLYRGRELGIAFGSIGAASGVASILIPIMSGIVIEKLDWRWMYAALSIVLVLTLVAGQLLLPKKQTTAEKFRIDYLGLVFAGLGVVLLTVGLTKLAVWGWWTALDAPFTIFGLSPALPMLVIGTIILVVLVSYERAVEKKYTDCLLPSIFVKNGQVRAGLYMNSFQFLCLGAVMFMIISWLQIVVNYDPLLTAVAVLIMPLSMIIFSVGIPIVFYRASPCIICTVAVILAAGSCPFMIYGLETASVNILLYVGLFFMGCAQVMIASQASMIVSQSVSDSQAAQSGGIQAAMRSIGSVIGLTVVGAALMLSLNSGFRDDINAAHFREYVTNQVNEIKVVGFVSDRDVDSFLGKRDLTTTELVAVKQIYATSRLKAARTSMWILAAVALLHLLALKNISRQPFIQH